MSRFLRWWRHLEYRKATLRADANMHHLIQMDTCIFGAGFLAQPRWEAMRAPKTPPAWNGYIPTGPFYTACDTRQFARPAGHCSERGAPGTSFVQFTTSALDLQ